MVLFSLGRTCFVLVCSRSIMITWQEYEYAGVDFPWTDYKRRWKSVVILFDRWPPSFWNWLYYTAIPQRGQKVGGGGGNCFSFYQISRLKTKNEKACKILCQLQLPNINLPQSKHQKYNIPLLSLWWCDWFIFRGTGSYLLPPIPKHYNPRIFRVTGANQNIATDWSGKY